MKFGYLLYKSVTYAQAAQRALISAGIRATISRAPKQISQDGCAYVIRTDANNIGDALAETENSGRAPYSVFTGDGMGYFQPYSI